MDKTPKLNFTFGNSQQFSASENKETQDNSTHEENGDNFYNKQEEEENGDEGKGQDDEADYTQDSGTAGWQQDDDDHDNEENDGDNEYEEEGGENECSNQSEAVIGRETSAENNKPTVTISGFRQQTTASDSTSSSGNSRHDSESAEQNRINPITLKASLRGSENPHANVTFEASRNNDGCSGEVAATTGIGPDSSITATSEFPNHTERPDEAEVKEYGSQSGPTLRLNASPPSRNSTAAQVNVKKENQMASTTRNEHSDDGILRSISENGIQDLEEEFGLIREIQQAVKEREVSRHYLFKKPKTDAKAGILPFYEAVVKESMWLEEIDRRLSCGEIKSLEHYVGLVRQMYINALEYNYSYSLHPRGEFLQEYQWFEELLKSYQMNDRKGIKIPRMEEFHTCTALLEELLSTQDDEDPQRKPLIFYVAWPPKTYGVAGDYHRKVKRQQWVGRVSRNLYSSYYENAGQFVRDLLIGPRAIKLYYRDSNELIPIAERIENKIDALCRKHFGKSSKDLVASYDVTYPTDDYLRTPPPSMELKSKRSLDKEMKGNSEVTEKLYTPQRIRKRPKVTEEGTFNRPQKTNKSLKTGSKRLKTNSVQPSDSRKVNHQPLEVKASRASDSGPGKQLLSIPIKRSSTQESAEASKATPKISLSVGEPTQTPTVKIKPLEMSQEECTIWEVLGNVSVEALNLCGSNGEKNRDTVMDVIDALVSKQVQVNQTYFEAGQFVEKVPSKLPEFRQITGGPKFMNSITEQLNNESYQNVKEVAVDIQKIFNSYRQYFEVRHDDKAEIISQIVDEVESQFHESLRSNFGSQKPKLLFKISGKQKRKRKPKANKWSNAPTDDDDFPVAPTSGGGTGESKPTASKTAPLPAKKDKFGRWLVQDHYAEQNRWVSLCRKLFRTLDNAPVGFEIKPLWNCKLLEDQVQKFDSKVGSQWRYVGDDGIVHVFAFNDLLKKLIGKDRQARGASTTYPSSMYTHPDEFHDDVKIVFSNFKKFWGAENGRLPEKGTISECFWLVTDYMEHMFDTLWKEEVEIWYNPHAAEQRREVVNEMEETVHSTAWDRLKNAQDKVSKVVEDLVTSKHGRSFEKPVLQSYPDIKEEYLKVVEDPICLEEIESKIDNDRYTNFGEAYKDIIRVFDNAIAYNGRYAEEGDDASHQIVAVAEKLKDKAENSWLRDVVIRGYLEKVGLEYEAQIDEVADACGFSRVKSKEKETDGRTKPTKRRKRRTDDDEDEFEPIEEEDEVEAEPELEGDELVEDEGEFDEDEEDFDTLDRPAKSGRGRKRRRKAKAKSAPSSHTKDAVTSILKSRTSTADVTIPLDHANIYKTSCGLVAFRDPLQRRTFRKPIEGLNGESFSAGIKDICGRHYNISIDPNFAQMLETGVSPVSEPEDQRPKHESENLLDKLTSQKEADTECFMGPEESTGDGLADLEYACVYGKADYSTKRYQKTYFPRSRPLFGDQCKGRDVFTEETCLAPSTSRNGCRFLMPWLQWSNNDFPSVKSAIIKAVFEDLVPRGSNLEVETQYFYRQTDDVTDSCLLQISVSRKVHPSLPRLAADRLDALRYSATILLPSDGNKQAIGTFSGIAVDGSESHSSSSQVLDQIAKMQKESKLHSFYPALPPVTFNYIPLAGLMVHASVATVNLKELYRTTLLNSLAPGVTARHIPCIIVRTLSSAVCPSPQFHLQHRPKTSVAPPKDDTSASTSSQAVNAKGQTVCVT